MNAIERIRHLREVASRFRSGDWIDTGAGVCHQGDVYVHAVPSTHPHGRPLETRQIAFGTTQGSRHILEGDVQVFEGTALPEGVLPRTPLGPFFLVGPGGARLTHPEHSHWVLVPNTAKQTTLQLDAITGAAALD